MCECNEIHVVVVVVVFGGLSYFSYQYIFPLNRHCCQCVWELKLMLRQWLCIDWLRRKWRSKTATVKERKREGERGNQLSEIWASMLFTSSVYPKVGTLSKLSRATCSCFPSTNSSVGWVVLVVVVYEIYIYCYENRRTYKHKTSRLQCNNDQSSRHKPVWNAHTTTFL